MTSSRAAVLSALPDVGRAGFYTLFAGAISVIYFGLTAWSEINSHRWAGKVKSAASQFAVPSGPTAS